jgi:hypothetical protein
MRIRAEIFLAAVVSTVGIATVLCVPRALAEITGPCAASIDGQSVANRSTGASGDPITVKRHSTPVVSMRSARPISHLKVSIAFGGFSWTVHDEPTSGNSWQKTVNVDHYATYGVGLYKVSGESTGPNLDCSGAALVKVDGSPLSTVAGGVALALTVLGALGVLGTVVLNGRGTGGGRRWPRLWPAAILAGLLGAIGVGTLLQQYAVLYPTRAVAIIELVAGLALGIMLPAFVRLVAVR